MKLVLWIIFLLHLGSCRTDKSTEKTSKDYNCSTCKVEKQAFFSSNLVRAKQIEIQGDRQASATNGKLDEYLDFVELQIKLVIANQNFTITNNDRILNIQSIHEWEMLPNRDREFAIWETYHKLPSVYELAAISSYLTLEDKDDNPLWHKFFEKQFNEDFYELKGSLTQFMTKNCFSAALSTLLPINILNIISEHQFSHLLSTNFTPIQKASKIGDLLVMSENYLTVHTAIYIGEHNNESVYLSKNGKSEGRFLAMLAKDLFKLYQGHSSYHRMTVSH